MSWRLSALNHPTLQVTGHTCFPGSRDYLLERRIAGHRVGEFAGLSRIGAAEFDGGGRAAALAIAKVRVPRARRAVRDAGRRVEAAEQIAAVERTWPATWCNPV